MPPADVSRVADLHLRGIDRLLSARVHWPGHREPLPALVVHLGSPSDADEICRAGHIVLTVNAPVEEAQRIVEWAADHGPELGASRRLYVAGPGAIDVVSRSRRTGWPTIELLPARLTYAQTTQGESE